ncbi:MAG: tRNA (mnm(5)s(2)U34)-methyltransferase [Bacilli bacterium]
MKNVLSFSKQLLIENLKKEDIVVDATIGNGHDTLFLCQNFKYVYGFDIQEIAVEATRNKLGDYSNYELILASHERVGDFVTECSGAIFNLGYLPNFDHAITTNFNSTIKAVESLLSIIKNGIIVIVVYTGHDEGEEARELEKFLSKIDKKHDVLKYQFINRVNSPYILAVKIGE